MYDVLIIGAGVCGSAAQGNYPDISCRLRWWKRERMSAAEPQRRTVELSMRDLTLFREV